MSAAVITLWSGEHEKRIRIPGPGETFPDPAKIIILPVVSRAYLPEPKPPRKPRSNPTRRNTRCPKP